MDTKQARELLKKYRKGTLSPGEENILDGWYLTLSREENVDLSGIDLEEKKMALFERLAEEINPQRNTRKLWVRIAAAASILLALSFGGYFLLHKPTPPQIAQNQIHDIAPGGNKAILTLANGQKISITDAQNGKVAQQANAGITKTKNGQLVYVVNSSAAAEEVYNTVTTPVTGQHEVTLSDGTEVILDAQSSITFPVAFTGRDRKVSMTGQVYFKVKHNDQQPFLVNVKGQTIRDIGTEFNVNAYDEEPTIKTTLVSGSVKVNERLLKPGEQAINRNNDIIVQAADVEAITAWKDGNFIFRHQDLQATMRQLARWYNVTITYDNAPQNVHIGGNISRSRPLSVVLAAMEKTGEIKFKLNGRNLTVTQ